MALWVGEKIELYEGELLVFKRANSPMWYLRIYVAKEKKYYQKSCRTKSKFNAIDYAKAQYKEIQQKVSKDEKVFTITLSEALELLAAKAASKKTSRSKKNNSKSTSKKKVATKKSSKKTPVTTKTGRLRASAVRVIKPGDS